MNFIKSFVDWFTLKPKLDSRTSKAPSFSEREIWMCYWGVNVGFELDGKNEEALRPIIIFKKLSHETCLAIPLSTGDKEGSWYSASLVQGVEGRYCMNQIRMIDRKRLKYRIVRVGEPEFKKLNRDFKHFLAL